MSRCAVIVIWNLKGGKPEHCPHDIRRQFHRHIRDMGFTIAQMSPGGELAPPTPLCTLTPRSEPWAHGYCVDAVTIPKEQLFRYAEELELLKPTTDETADAQLDDAFCYAPFRIRDAMSQPSKYRNWANDRSFFTSAERQVIAREVAEHLRLAQSDTKLESLDFSFDGFGHSVLTECIKHGIVPEDGVFALHDTQQLVRVGIELELGHQLLHSSNTCASQFMYYDSCLRRSSARTLTLCSDHHVSAHTCNSIHIARCWFAPLVDQVAPHISSPSTHAPRVCVAFGTRSAPRKTSCGIGSRIRAKMVIAFGWQNISARNMPFTPPGCRSTPPG